MILKQLDHPNILKLYSIFEDNHSFYLVTEYFFLLCSYLEGGDLLTKLQQGSFTEEQIR